MHTSKRFFENISWLVMGTIISNIISIVISIFIIRKLSIADFGIYSLFIGSLSIFSILSINGILLSLRRFIPELIQKKYFSYHKSLIIKLYLLSLLIAFVSVLIVFLYKKEIGVLLNIREFELYFSIFIINIFLYLQTAIAQDVLNSLFEQKFIQIIGSISIIIRGSLYAFFATNLTIDLIFIIEAICVGFKAVFFLWYVFKKISDLTNENDCEINIKEKVQFRRRITRYTLLSTANEVGEGGFSQVSDYYFISAYLGTHSMGLYAFPYKLISSIFSWIPVDRMNEMFKLYFIKKYYEKNESKEYLTSMFNFLFKIYFLFYGVIIVGLLSYQKLIQTLVFNSKYLETQLLVFIILIFYLNRALGYPTHIIIEVKEQIEYTLYAKIFAVFNVIAVIFVLRYTNWNLIGVALATGISNFLRYFYLYLRMKKISNIKIVVADFAKVLLLLSIVGLSMYWASLSDNITLQIILPLLIGTVTFLASYRVIRPFNNNEELMMSNFFEKISVKANIISKILALNHS